MLSPVPLGVQARDTRLGQCSGMTPDRAPRDGAAYTCAKLPTDGCDRLRPGCTAAFQSHAEPRPRRSTRGWVAGSVGLAHIRRPVREVATTDPAQVATREYVFAVPLDVMGNLARKLTEVYERQRGTTL